MSLTRTLHKFASPVLYKTGLYEKHWHARSRKTPFAFVLVYHRVVADIENGDAMFDIEKGTPASVFEQQMRFLLRHFSAVKASQIQPGVGSDIQFAVTLDDGYEDNYLVAAPILKKLGIPATFYVVSDFVGTDRLFWWEQVAELIRKSARPELDLMAVVPDLCQAEDDLAILPMRNDEERSLAYEVLCARIRKGLHADVASHLHNLASYFNTPVVEQGRGYGLMNWAQLKELVQQGFEIGGHTASHCNVVGADESFLQRELIDSISVIENKLDTSVESFAYPYGMFEPANRVITKLLAKTNCRTAFTTVKGVITAGLPANELPRTKLNRAYGFACAFNVQEALNSGG